MMVLAPVWLGNIIANNSQRSWGQCLDIIAIGTGIANMWEGEGIKLTCIGRICQYFLMPVRGIETHLTTFVVSAPNPEPYDEPSSSIKLRWGAGRRKRRECFHIVNSVRHKAKFPSVHKNLA